MDLLKALYYLEFSMKQHKTKYEQSKLTVQETKRKNQKTKKKEQSVGNERACTCPDDDQVSNMIYDEFLTSFFFCCCK